MDKIVTSDDKGRVTGMSPKTRYYVQNAGTGVYYQPVPETEPVAVRDISRDQLAEILGLSATDIVANGGVTIGKLPPKHVGEDAGFGLTVKVFRRNEAGERYMNYQANALHTDEYLFRLV